MIELEMQSRPEHLLDMWVVGEKNLTLDNYLVTLIPGVLRRSERPFVPWRLSQRQKENLDQTWFDRIAQGCGYWKREDKYVLFMSIWNDEEDPEVVESFDQGLDCIRRSVSFRFNK